MSNELLFKQVANLNKNVQGLENLVNEDIFRMLDNMSLCVTQKENEVQNLAQKVVKLEQAHDRL